jgi:mRNA interferase HigB
MLREYIEAGHADAEQALHGWYVRATKAEWASFQDIRRDFSTADLVGDRIVFNIRGNNYRLICGFSFADRLLFTKWIGTHAEYDRVDVRSAKMP